VVGGLFLGGIGSPMLAWFVHVVSVHFNYEMMNWEHNCNVKQWWENRLMSWNMPFGRARFHLSECACCVLGWNGSYWVCSWYITPLPKIGGCACFIVLQPTQTGHLTKKVVGCNRFHFSSPLWGIVLQYLCKYSVSGILPVPLFRNVPLGKKGKIQNKMPKRENK
jgi:hypothetical protein